MEEAHLIAPLFTNRSCEPHTMKFSSWTLAFLVLTFGSTAFATEPTAPGDLRVSVYSNRAAELFWARSTDDGFIANYEVQVNGAVAEVTEGISYFTEALTAGTSYEMSVVAIDNDGERSAPTSISFTGGDRNAGSDIGDEDPPENPLINSPGNLVAEIYSSSAAEIFWDRAPEGPRSYEVSVNGMLIENTTGTSAFFDQLDSGTEYTINVVAIDNDGNRSTSSTVAFTTNPGGSSSGGSTGGGDPIEVDVEPPAPQNALLIKYSRTAGELFWDRPAASGGVVGTEVYRDGVLLETTDGTSFFDDSRARDTNYTYQLIALNADGVASDATVIREGGTTGTDTGGSTGTDTGGSTGTDTGCTTGTGTGGSTGTDTGGTTGTDTGGTTGTDTGGTTGGTSGDDVFAALPTDITDLDEFYDQDGYDSVDVLRVDIRTNTTAGTCEIEDQSGCTLADVIADVNGNDDFKVEIPIHFQAEDFADDGSDSNATLRQRGNTARLGPQKSFRIKLDSKDDLWRRERRLQLNKHPFERTRIRNKVSFDLMRELPHLPSLRTQFVNLWIDDGEGPEDYGLFTHVEFAGKEYLQNRGRDKDDNLYKIEFFQFSQGDLNNVQVDEDGEPLDEDRFESSLQIERGDDHSAVVEMLTAMNDPAIDFDTILDQYFNRNNVLMWITANLLLHQTDAITHNFYLYNPAGTTRFYFLPWDYDGTFQPESIFDNSYDNDELAKRLFYGYARGVNSDFVSRYYKLPGIHEKILAAADVIRNTWLTDAAINETATSYRDIVEPFMTQLPDSEFNRFNPNIPENFANFVASIHDNMRNAFDIPMPPSIEDPEINGEFLQISWTPAFDVTRSHELSYDLELSTSVDFGADDIFISVEGIEDDPELLSFETELDTLPEGPLYARVTARSSGDPVNVWQIAENTLRVDGTTYFGIVEIELP